MLTEDPAITALVADRIDKGPLPSNPTLPVIAFRNIFDAAGNHLARECSAVNELFRIDAWDDSR